MSFSEIELDWIWLKEYIAFLPTCNERERERESEGGAKEGGDRRKW